jgi:hypothetical protein
VCCFLEFSFVVLASFVSGCFSFSFRVKFFFRRFWFVFLHFAGSFYVSLPVSFSVSLCVVFSHTLSHYLFHALPLIIPFPPLSEPPHPTPLIYRFRLSLTEPSLIYSARSSPSPTFREWRWRRIARRV